MKKVIALILAVAMILTAAVAFAAPGTVCEDIWIESAWDDNGDPTEWTQVSDCGVGYDFNCDKHNVPYGSQQYRWIHFPAIYEPTYTMSFKMNVNTEQALYRQVVTKGLKKVFGDVVGDATHMWEVVDFNATLLNAENLENMEDGLVLELRTQESPSVYRQYRAIVKINDEWVEIPCSTKGFNWLEECKDWIYEEIYDDNGEFVGYGDLIQMGCDCYYWNGDEYVCINEYSLVMAGGLGYTSWKVPGKWGKTEIGTPWDMRDEDGHNQTIWVNGTPAPGVAIFNGSAHLLNYYYVVLTAEQVEALNGCQSQIIIISK